ncbi:PQQ-dependent sugar dehydrogenase [Deltaproteobacteria bacterium TL4]
MLLLLLHSSLLFAQGANDWVTVKDHVVEVDTQGWMFPVEIAFVPNPGSHPKDPLYYVTELRGTIKVVTNDRTIHTYAEHVNAYRPPSELPNTNAEMGLTGLCLDPVHGYLFATTIYPNKGLVYNKIVRFEHETNEFALTPKTFIEFTRIFEQDESGPSHQIGTCAINSQGQLFVGVGDGHTAYKSQGLDNPNGKLLRMNLDFSAPKDNPFYNSLNPDSVTNYIYAYGLRNPYGVTLGERDTVYVTDNGPDWDRMIEVTPGKNYLWDGDNRSMISDGFWDWHGSVGPAGLSYIGKSARFPYWEDRLLVAQGGTIGELGPSKNGKITINSFKVKPGMGLQQRPETLVWFRGNYQQLLVPVVLGPDGIYFSGFFPNAQGETYILKIIRREGAISEERTLSGAQIYEQKGCAGCHKINAIGGSMGPALDGLVERLKQKLFSKEYEAQLVEVDKVTTKPHVDYQKQRQTLRGLKGDEKIKVWLHYHLTEPRFDVLLSQMPNLPLSDYERAQMVQYLMTLKNAQRSRLTPMQEWHRQFKAWWDTDYNARPTVGFVVGCLFVLCVQLFVRKIRKRFRFSRN